MPHCVWFECAQCGMAPPIRTAFCGALHTNEYDPDFVGTSKIYLLVGMFSLDGMLLGARARVQNTVPKN